MIKQRETACVFIDRDLKNGRTKSKPQKLVNLRDSWEESLLECTAKPFTMWMMILKEAQGPSDSIRFLVMTQRYRASQTARGWTEEYCRYLDYIAPIDISYVATQQGRSRYEKMFVLKLNDGKHPGRMTIRDDFPHAARALGALEREQGRVNPQIPKKKTRATTTKRWKIAIRSWVAKLLLECQLVASILFIFNKLVAFKKMTWTTRRRMARSAMVGRVVNTVSLSHQPFCKNLAHS